MSEDLSYPIGKFKRPEAIDTEAFKSLLERLAKQPAGLRSAVAGLNDAQLDTPYRPGGWTVRQLVHHVADSHMNMYVRLKLAMTEHNPTIKPYDQDAWVLLTDTRETPIDVSLGILEGVHVRALSVLRSTSDTDRARTFLHPENGPTRIDGMTALYAWHGDHHIAHINNLRTRMGW